MSKTVGSRRLVLTWCLIAVDAKGKGHGTCGHRHADALEAVRCPWTPLPWPEVCDLLVRQVRDPIASGDGETQRDAEAAP